MFKWCNFVKFNCFKRFKCFKRFECFNRFKNLFKALKWFKGLKCFKRIKSLKCFIIFKRFKRLILNGFIIDIKISWNNTFKCLLKHLILAIVFILAWLWKPVSPWQWADQEGAMLCFATFSYTSPSLWTMLVQWLVSSSYHILCWDSMQIVN